MEQLARSTDPDTSHRGAADIRPRQGTQMWGLLQAYLDAGDLGLTADEAGEDADLTHTGYWKRCSDLYQAGFTRTLMDGDRVVTRPGRAGSSQEVRIITSKGRSWISVNA
jgi:hypothetical protein